jgi:arsenate reductase (glutaredoxin)
MKKAILIYNPGCSKSRSAKKILEDKGVDFEIIDYLKDGLKEKLLLALPELLKISYSEMIRDKEEVYKELDLKNKAPNNNEWIKILMKNPILLERPIFIYGAKAVIARPPELVETLV